MSAHFSAHAIEGVPMIEPGDALAQMFLDAISANGLALEDGDILVVAQKVVSKAEGRYVRLDSVAAGEEAIRIANVTGKDARLVEIIGCARRAASINRISTMRTASAHCCCPKIPMPRRIV